MAQKPSIPKGTRDFGPEEMIRKKSTFSIRSRASSDYTASSRSKLPRWENLSTLLGKYGDEGDKLLFKILNSGDFLSGSASDETGCTGTRNALSTTAVRERGCGTT